MSANCLRLSQAAPGDRRCRMNLEQLQFEAANDLTWDFPGSLARGPGFLALPSLHRLEDFSGKICGPKATATMS